MTAIHKLTRAFALLFATAVAGIGPVMGAGPCPERLIKIIVPNPAGGTGDLVARLLGDKAGAILEQPMVIENRAGASTTIGTASVAQSKPDGCTLLSLTSSGVVVSVLRDKLPYDLERDFTPIVGVGSFPMVLAVPISSKITSFADLAAAIKSPDGSAYASGGAGTLAHLSSARLIKELNGHGTHVPFRGNSNAMQALLGNQVQFFFPSTAETIPLLQGNKIRALAITAEKRLPSMPNVPTMKELGFAEFSPRLWYAFLAPARTPTNIVSRLQSAFAQAVSDPVIIDKLANLGYSTDLKTPSELAAFMKMEAARWSKVIKENNIASTD